MSSDLTNYFKRLKLEAMAKVSKALRDYFAEIGRKGGKARVPKGPATLSPERRSEIARNAVKARWAKLGKLKKGRVK